MTGPLISVIIPTYNREKTISRCLESILSQTFKPLEIIVIDDCSSDNTADRVSCFKGMSIPLTCIVAERNAGAQAARNKGIHAAKGNWIAFLDSDDEWAPDKLERQVEILQNMNESLDIVVHTDCWRYDSMTDKKSLWSLPLVDGDSALVELLRGPSPMFQGMLVSKDALIQVGFLDELVPAYQEWDTAIRLARNCCFVHLRQPLFTYHLHTTEAISADNRRDVAGYQYIIDKHRQEILQYTGVNCLIDHLEWNAIRAMSNGDFSDAGETLEKSPGKSLKLSTLKWLTKRRISPAAYVRIMNRIQSPLAGTSRYSYLIARH